MTDDTALCRTLGRYKLLVDKGDLGFSSHVILDGFWQIWMTRAILGTVREGMAVAEVGANVGYFTLLLADLVGEAGHVHAVEPNPRGMQLLQQSVALNGFASRVSLHRDALAAPAKAAAVRPAGTTPGRKALSTRTAAARSAPGDVRVPEPRGVCLDDIVGDGKLDFVKIDGRGAERDIWRGMGRILARQQPLTVVLDFTPGLHRDPGAFLAEMTTAGFRLARVDASGTVVAASREEIMAFPSSGSQTLSLSR